MSESAIFEKKRLGDGDGDRDGDGDGVMEMEWSLTEDSSHDEASSALKK